MQFDTREQRKMLSTASATAGAYRVDVWTEQFSPSDTDIYARLSRNGSIVDGRIPVARSSRNELDPSVSITSTGRFAVAYEQALSATDSDVMARVFNGNGAALTGTLTVANSAKNEWDPHVSINGAGRFVVAYDLQFSTSDIDVMARQFSPANSAGSSYSTQSFTVANTSHNEFDPHVLVAGNGNFAVSYTHRFSSTDLDVKAAVFRNGIGSTFTIANSTANETDSIVESFNGSNSLTVSYAKGGIRRTRSLFT